MRIMRAIIRVTQPLHRGNRHTPIEHTRSKRYTVPHIVQQHFALNFSLLGHLEHVPRDIHPNPIMSQLTQPIARKPRPTPDIEQQLCNTVIGKVQQLHRALGESLLNLNHARARGVLARLGGVVEHIRGSGELGARHRRGRRARNASNLFCLVRLTSDVDVVVATARVVKSRVVVESQPPGGGCVPSPSMASNHERSNYHTVYS